MDKKDLTTRVARWALLLEEFDYTIEHRSGSRLPHVDALSRYPVMTITATDGLKTRIRKAQDEDNEVRVIKEVLKNQPYEDYFIKDDVLYKYSDGFDVLVIPTSMQNEIIKKIHDEGHFAAKKIEEKIKQEFYIPKLKTKIDRCISRCVSCILSNRKRGKQEGYLHPLHKESSPLHTYHIDHLGPLESTYQRSIHTSPFELLIGVEMKNKSDHRIKQLIDEETQSQFKEERENLRETAKIHIIKIQQENKKTYNLRRRASTKYLVNDLVAIKRTQFGPGLKLKPKYLGPYKITRVKPNNTYDVEKEGTHEGPYSTSTCAEYMKPWIPYENDQSSGTDDLQDGRTVGTVSRLASRDVCPMREQIDLVDPDQVSG